MIVIGKGPLTTEVTRAQAMALAKTHGRLSAAELRSLTMDEVEGRWVAAFVREAGEPPFGPPKPDAGGPPPGDGPPDEDGPPSPDGAGPPEDDEDSDVDGPPKEKDEKGDKGGDKELLHHLLDMVTQISTALGLPGAGGPGDSPVPGADDTPPPPDGMPPGADAGGPPPSPHGDKPLKPGEVPAGGTPVGSPAFASVHPNHPWAHVVGKVASISLDEAIGNAPMAQVVAEVDHLAKTAGYKVKQLQEYRTDDGERRARGMVSVY